MGGGFNVHFVIFQSCHDSTPPPTHTHTHNLTYIPFFYIYHVYTKYKNWKDSIFMSELKSTQAIGDLFILCHFTAFELELEYLHMPVNLMCEY